MDLSFFRYARSVFARAFKDAVAAWRGLLISGSLSVAILVYQVKGGVVPQGQVSARLWALLPYLFLVVALGVWHLCLAPWRLAQEAAKAMEAIESERERLRAVADTERLDREARKRKAALVGFLRDGAIRIYQQKIPIEELERWQADVRNWTEDASKRLSEHCDDSVMSRFAHPGPFTSMMFEHSVNGVHTAWLLNLHSRLKLLEELSGQLQTVAGSGASLLS